MTPQTLPLTTLSALLETQQQILTMLERIAVAVEHSRAREIPHEPRSDGPLVSLKEAAMALGCHEVTLWKQIKRHQYPHYRVGRRIKVNMDEIRSIMQHQEREA